MKTRTLIAKSRSAFTASILASSLFIGAAAQAASEGDRPRPGRPIDAPPPAEARFARRPAAAAALGSVLSPEQRQQVRARMEAQGGRLRDLAQAMRRVRRELAECTLGKELNEEGIRRNSARLSELQTEMLLLRARVLATIRPPLTPDQRERLMDMFSQGGFDGPDQMGAPFWQGRGGTADRPPWAGRPMREGDPEAWDRRSDFRGPPERPPRGPERDFREPTDRESEADRPVRRRSEREDVRRDSPPREREVERERERPPAPPKEKRRKEGDQPEEREKPTPPEKRDSH